ncbi:MAG: transposase, partial [Patescibacteria group bacterium]
TPKGVSFNLAIAGKKNIRESVISLRNHKHKLIESIVYTDTANTDLILEYLNILVSKLPKNSFIVLDNATYHNNNRVKELVKNSNITLIFLPPYSPELNPIERLWGSVKKHLRNYYNNSLSLRENLNNSLLYYSG